MAIYDIFDRISYHAVYDESIISSMEYAGRNGFTGVQVSIESPHLSFERLSSSDIDAIADYSSETGIRILLHAPDDVTSLFVTSSYLQKGILDYYSALFHFADKAGCKLITFHLGSISTFSTNTVPKQMVPDIDMAIYRSALADNLQRLVDMAYGRFVLCIENYKLNADILDVIQPYLDSNSLFLCWDIAKTFDKSMNKDIALEEYFLQNIDSIKQVHLHDINTDGSHRIIGSGKMDFPHYIRLLRDADVIDYCIEVRPRECAGESLENLKTIYHKMINNREI
ncbi:MAG: sugar phosphate isomerase/epimerase family protein [Armatimonadota bacterium]